MTKLRGGEPNTPETEGVMEAVHEIALDVLNPDVPINGILDRINPLCSEVGKLDWRRFTRLISKGIAHRLRGKGAPAPRRPTPRMTAKEFVETRYNILAAKVDPIKPETRAFGLVLLKSTIIANETGVFDELRKEWGKSLINHAIGSMRMLSPGEVKTLYGI